MKKKILMIVLGSGWLILVFFMTSAYFFNKMSPSKNDFSFTPITWESHKQIIDGAIQCEFIDDELIERKRILKKEIFSHLLRKEEHPESIIYYFKEDPELLKSVLEHVTIEKACCPFFKFDISIPSFKQGFALQVSGSKDALDMIRDFESEDL